MQLETRPHQPSAIPYSLVRTWLTHGADGIQGYGIVIDATVVSETGPYKRATPARAWIERIPRETMLLPEIVLEVIQQSSSTSAGLPRSPRPSCSDLPKRGAISSISSPAARNRPAEPEPGWSIRVSIIPTAKSSRIAWQFTKGPRPASCSRPACRPSLPPCLPSRRALDARKTHAGLCAIGRRLGVSTR